MNKTKMRFMSTAVALVLVIFLAACGGKSGEGGTGTEAKTASGSEPYNIDIYTFSTGTFTYVLGTAIADVVNNTSTRLRVTSVESPGSTPNELMMRDADDTKRKHTIYYGIGDNAYRGTGEFKDNPSTRSKIAFTYGLSLNGLLTATPDIKKIEDFAGRSMALRSPVASINYYWQALIDQKVKGVKYEALSFSDCVESNLSGAIDGWFSGAFCISADIKEWIGNPATVEFFSRAKTVNFIDLPKDADDKIRKGTPGGDFENFYTAVVSVPAKSVDPRQTEPWAIALTNTCFLVDQDFPEDVLYELVKIVGDNSEKFKEYHPQAAFISPETMAIYTFPTEFHPGAAKYFQEKGIAPIFMGDLVEQSTK